MLFLSSPEANRQAILMLLNALSTRSNGCPTTSKSKKYHCKDVYSRYTVDIEKTARDKLLLNTNQFFSFVLFALVVYIHYINHVLRKRIFDKSQ